MGPRWREFWLMVILFLICVVLVMGIGAALV
jgi:uncharacterized membrane protein